MFDNLSDRLTGAFQKIRGQKRLDESNVQAGLREVRLALLEADVNFKVVKQFVDQVRDRALGEDVLKGLDPGQQVVKIVHEELVELLGGEQQGVDTSGARPLKIMMVGLQGSGKTTSSGKIAIWLRDQGFKPYLVPADVYRPAAIDQLVTLAGQIDVPVYPSTTEMNPVDICRDAMEKAAEAGCDAILFDTAGRLHVDEPLMQELAGIKEACTPQEILFVADAMTGQDAVTVAESFNERLDISGVVLTKMDGDARGGAALSIKSVTGKSVKFVGLGEKLTDMELFHPDRVASRILGMGDVLTLIEKAQTAFDEEDAERMAKKMQKAQFDLEDFRTNMRRLKKLGSMEGLLKMIPGMGGMLKQLGDVQMPEKELARTEAIINSMTLQERRQPKLLNAGRKERIARGCGMQVADVNKLIKHFEQMSKVMQKMMGGKKGKLPKMPKLPEGADPMDGMGGMPGMGMPGMPGMPGMDGMGGEAPAPGAGRSAKRVAADRKKKKLAKKQKKKQRKKR
ncbi:signal recognition particle subunit FFH/SRP54 (srp54) [Paucidesulfovibrio gracilis DSM 16080]|uniref:Signal recognition particle protein n=1 Tax=Paucidesulfovibrio gracilis DSM 16080 TaxID=1121449 RepID=A0A1T4XLV7_9BACT|nr:signal recognition particle protein [Paucidesulfovibrio gracilis]SKA90494.1 signal recognition particle subunit FFH/SRP54 (srp54) [Paucidesulfovibrio gracilis DSM 16080]